MEHKTFELIEAKAEGESGSFQAYASVFNNVDRGGDRMLPGSFKRTLAKWRKSEEGRKEKELHGKILDLREKKRRMAARQQQSPS